MTTRDVFDYDFRKDPRDLAYDDSGEEERRSLKEYLRDKAVAFISFMKDVPDYFKYIGEEIRNKGREEDEFIFIQMEETHENINAAIGGHIKRLGT